MSKSPMKTLSWLGALTLLLGPGSALASFTCPALCMVKGPDANGELRTGAVPPAKPGKGSDVTSAMTHLLDECQKVADRKNLKFGGSPVFSITGVTNPSGNGAPVCRDPAAEATHQEKDANLVTENLRLQGEIVRLKGELAGCSDPRSSANKVKDVEAMGYVVEKVRNGTAHEAR